METSPVTPLGAQTPHAHPAFAPVIAVLAAAAAVGIYLTLAYLQGWWPLARTPEPAASVSVSPSPSGVPVSYHNETFGFMVNLPESWRGFTVESKVMTATRIDGSQQTETFRQFNIIHPKSTSQLPRQDIPIMVLTTAQWERIVREELSVGAAPIPPSELARNSTYVFALPARYNYAFYDGWEEVEAIMKTNPVSAFEPSPSLPTGWKTYQSDFGFIFSYPPTAQFNFYGDGWPSLSLKEGGILTVDSGMGLLGVEDRFVSISEPMNIRIGAEVAEKYRYEAEGKCHGVVVVMSAGDEGDRNLLVDYNDCYVGGGRVPFPNAAQDAMFDRIVVTFRGTPQSLPLPEPPVDTGWTTFSSRYFTLSFQVPPGFTVEDAQNSLVVTQKVVDPPQPTLALRRYDGAYTRASAQDGFKGSHTSIRTTTVEVDGSSFTRMDGVAADSLVSQSLVLFDRSALLLSAGPTREDLSVVNRVLATFRFSK